jgi:hypothetical protein
LKLAAKGGKGRGAIDERKGCCGGSKTDGLLEVTMMSTEWDESVQNGMESERERGGSDDDCRYGNACRCEIVEK